MVPVLFVWVAISSTLSVPFADGVRRAAFAWWPEWLVLSTFTQNLNLYSPAVLWTVIILSFILNIAVPVVVPISLVALVLVDVEGYSYDQTAEITGANVGTVKSRLSRGRASLRDLLLAEEGLLPTKYRRQRPELN